MQTSFHSGEIEVRKQTGEEAIANANARIIKDTLIKGAIRFIENQPMLIVSSVDKKNQVWTSLVMGEHGFVKVPDAGSLSIDLDKVHSDRQDVFFKNIADRSQIGTLFIELSTRRRFRINGETSWDGNKIEVSILEAYPNCPKYIQQRSLRDSKAIRNVEVKKKYGIGFNKEIHDWISSSDTLFLGSMGNEGRLDASHRGGKRGFVEILNDTTLKVPDYQGNSLYNTFGNIAQNKLSGVLFIDFETKRTLQLTGKAALLFDQRSEMDLEKTGGTGRYWTFEVSEWILTENQHDVQWEYLGSSPFNP